VGTPREGNQLPEIQKEAELRVDYTTCTIQDIIKLCEKYLLNIPVTYRPCVDYQSAVEDNHTYQEIMVDLLEYVGTLQRQIKQPDVPRISTGTHQTRRPHLH
jgi:hypothetical protein